MAVTKQQVAELYVATFNRAPDAAGLDYWVNTSGLTIEEIAQSFFDQPETTTKYPLGTTDAAFVEAIYLNLFNRAPDADGLAYWVAKLTATETVPAEMTRDVMIEAMKNGAIALGGTDATIIANKATVGLAYVDAGLEGTTFSLASVTEVEATKTAALVAVDNLANPGQAFTLAPAIAEVNGTTGNDTFSGLFGTSNTADTLNTADVVDGKAGNDTLNLIATGAVASGIATINSVETINVRDVAGASLNATMITGVKNINFTTTISGQTSTVTGLADTSTVVGIAGEGNLTVTYNAGSLVGTSDTASVAVDGIGTKASTGAITRGTIDVSNTNTVEGVKLDAVNANYITLTTGTAVKTVTVTGAGSVNITGTALTGDATDSVLTYDASAATGAQTVTFGAGAITAKGGSANDTYNFGATMGSTDTIVGGEGTDTVSFTLGTAVQVLPTMTSVETLSATFNAAGIVNGSKMTGVNTINLLNSGGIAETLSNLSSTVNTFNITDGAAHGDITIGYATGAAATTTINVGTQNTTTAVGAAMTVGANTALTNASSVTINSIRDVDNTTAVVNTIGGTGLNIGTATSLTATTSDKASLTIGALTAGSVTQIDLNADGGNMIVDTLVTADKLTDLTITAANKADVTTGAIGATKGATVMTNYSVTTGSESTVNLGAVDAALDATASVAGASALKTITYNLGSKATVTSIGAVAAVDGGTAATNYGVGLAQLDSIDFTLGADAVTGAVTVGAISGRSVATANFTVADQSTAHTTGATLTMDESIGAANIAVGLNETFTLALKGIDDSGLTDTYNLAVGTITASGKGNVVVDIGTTVALKSVSTIDMSAVEGTSAVTVSTALSGTAGMNITIGKGGTGTGNVNGSANADIILGGAGADTILGGAGADQITGGLGIDTITGGAGADTIDLTEATSSADVIIYRESCAANVDSVTGFKAGTDMVKFSYTNTDFSTVALASADGTDISAVGATSATVAVNTSAAVADGAEILFFSNTAATSFATAIGTAVITDTTGTNWTNNTAIAAVYFDANNGQAVYGYITDTAAAGTAITTADTFVEVTRVGITATDFTLANVVTSGFDFIA